MNRAMQSLLLAGLLLAGSPLAAQDDISEITTSDFYDGISVTAMKLASGNFVALVSVADDTSESGGAQVRARYDLYRGARRGIWRVWQPGEGSPIKTVMEYSDGQFSGQLDNILERHSVASITLSALWLYEDYLLQEARTANLLKHSTKNSCTPIPNGCSGWFVPDSCAGTSIMGACNAHDECYQCGAECEGRTRADCDSAFRTDIYNATGSTWCANVYWFGVRALGWLFFQDPTTRPNMGGDVYSLGIEISACEGQYAHLCTTYVM